VQPTHVILTAILIVLIIQLERVIIQLSSRRHSTRHSLGFTLCLQLENSQREELLASRNCLQRFCLYQVEAWHCHVLHDMVVLCVLAVVDVGVLVLTWYGWFMKHLQ